VTDRERDVLLEQILSAHREPHARLRVRSHPAWHDLPDSDRERAFEAALALRTLEAALDPGGLSTAARAVLARIGPDRASASE